MAKIKSSNLNVSIFWQKIHILMEQLLLFVVTLQLHYVAPFESSAFRYARTSSHERKESLMLTESPVREPPQRYFVASLPF